jgi:hypothetical protein
MMIVLKIRRAGACLRPQGGLRAGRRDDVQARRPAKMGLLAITAFSSHSHGNT